jgi:hypothetical protein
MNTVYTTVSQNRVLLWRTGSNSPSATIATNAQTAWTSGNQIIVQFKNGATGIFELTRSGTSAYPVRITR